MKEENNSGVKQSFYNSRGEMYCVVYYDANLNATVDQWHGDFQTRENFRAALEEVLTNIKFNESKKWLADLSLMANGFEESREWIARNVVPRALALGLRFEALVLPYNIFAMLSVQETLVMIESLEIRIFGDVEAAKEWLLAVH